jgi:hypothetical protein
VITKLRHTGFTLYITRADNLVPASVVVELLVADGARAAGDQELVRRQHRFGQRRVPATATTTVTRG